MISPQNTNGLTLLEILVVMTIIALLSVLPLVSLSGSKNTVLLQSTFEIIEDNMSLAHQAVLGGDILSTTVHFSINSPQLYYYTDDFQLTSSQEDTLASNLQITAITEVSNSSDGLLTLNWTDPASDNVRFQAIGGKEEIVDLPVPPDVTASDPVIISPLNAAQKFQFILSHPVSEIKGEQITLLFFSKENLDPFTKTPLLISNIEVQDAFGSWVPADSVDIKILSPLAKKKYFVATEEYRAARITLSYNATELSHQF